MAKGFIITGTDTDVGKTIFAAALTHALEGVYWKPLQSGTVDGTDRARVEVLLAGKGCTLPETYLFKEPLSPHRAAEIDGVSIDLNTLVPPSVDLPLIIEGAGGLCVPVTRELLYIDLFKKWKLPVVLCARTRLGTINHTLLSVEALRQRGIPLHGIVFIGEEMPDTQHTIADFTGAKILGRLPFIENLDAPKLHSAFARHFKRSDFE